MYSPKGVRTLSLPPSLMKARMVRSRRLPVFHALKFKKARQKIGTWSKFVAFSIRCHLAVFEWEQKGEIYCLKNTWKNQTWERNRNLRTDIFRPMTFRQITIIPQDFPCLCSLRISFRDGSAAVSAMDGVSARSV